MRTRLLFALALFLAAGAVAEAGDKAWYGFRLKVETGGFPLNPIVRSVIVQSVVPNTPATEQQIRPGDEIIEAEGRTVPGGRALQLRPIMSKQAGEVLRLRLKRANGETYSAVLTGIKKPSS